MVEIGPRDIANNGAFVGRRDKARNERFNLHRDELVSSAASILDDMQAALFSRAKTFREQHTREIDDWAEFVAFFTPQNPERPEIHGGFALSHWCGSRECEERINDELSVTLRCIPFDSETPQPGKCLLCGGESKQRAVFAKAY